MTVPDTLEDMADPGKKIILTNRKARHDFTILDTLEAGVILLGSEVKSLRNGHVQLSDAYAHIEGMTVWLDGIIIAPYSHAQGFGAHMPDRRRRLLLNKREIERLGHQMKVERLTLVPLTIYFKDGRVKVELALCKGRTKSDKRQALAERDSKAEITKALGRQQKGMTA
jgi:SsrA-binding protein